MSQAMKPRQGRRSKRGAGFQERKALDALARQLCPKALLRAERQQQELFRKKGWVGIVKVFPVWKPYRNEARKIFRLQRALPVLKLFPLGVSLRLSQLLFP